MKEKKYRILETGPLGVNCILLPLGDTLYIIDPAGESGTIAAEAAEYPCTKYVILLTHAHVDHIAGVGKLAEKLNTGTIFMNADDRELYESPANAILPFIPHPENLPRTLDTELLHEPRIQVLPCPGHSCGGSAFYVPELETVFAGDTIFFESVGRTDLTGGDFELLKETIRNRIYTLPDQTVIVPGHGPETTVAHEKEYNPYVTEA